MNKKQINTINKNKKTEQGSVFLNTYIQATEVAPTGL
jgi:hypothetical protein